MVSERQLEALFLANDDFLALESQLDVFCPFEAMGVVDQEIRHGRFLRYLFDPQRPHGFGAECLRALMTAAAGAMGEGRRQEMNPLDVHLMEFDSAIVPQREYKSIDILVEIPGAKLVVAVELKIDAAEHSGQLAKYKKVVEADWPADEGWRHVLLFLTKRGENPSDLHGVGWTTLPLQLLVDELHSVYSRGGGVSGARGFLSAYIEMMRRRHLTDDRLEELARRLWAQHREALEYLSERRPDAASELFETVLEDQPGFAESISQKLDLELLPDKSSKTYLRFAVTKWDNIPGFLTGIGWPPSNRLMVYEIYRDTKGGVRCHFQLGPGDQDARTRIFQTLRDAGCNVGGSWDLYPKWRTLASQVLIKNAEEASQSEVPLVDQLETAVVSFLKKHLPCYERALDSVA